MSEHDENRLAAVRQGMRVVDVDGADVGKVDAVQMGDPEAATTQGEGRASDGLLHEIASAFTGGPDVHPQLAARLVRTGYLAVDAGLGHGNRYAAADQVGEVSDDVVRLTVRGDELGGTG